VSDMDNEARKPVRTRFLPRFNRRAEEDRQRRAFIEAALKRAETEVPTANGNHMSTFEAMEWVRRCFQVAEGAFASTSSVEVSEYGSVYSEFLDAHRTYMHRRDALPSSRTLVAPIEDLKRDRDYYREVFDTVMKAHSDWGVSLSQIDPQVAHQAARRAGLRYSDVAYWQGDFALLLERLDGDRWSTRLVFPGDDQYEAAERYLTEIHQLSVAIAAELPFVEANLLEVIRVPGVLGPDGKPVDLLDREARPIVARIRSTSERIFEHCARHPESLDRLTPREFEELTAEAWSRGGWEVTLTPFSRDGGVDIFAAKADGFASILYAVQCKHVSSPVGVDVIRELNGVIDMHRTTGGAVATTNRFTRGAREERERFVKWTIDLHDVESVKRWLSEDWPSEPA
jgi:Restriction endonuclease